MRNIFAIVLLLSSVAFGQLASRDPLDAYGAKATANCPAEVTGGQNNGTSQLVTTSSTAVTGGTTQAIAVASLTEGNVGGALGDTLGFTQALTTATWQPSAVVSKGTRIRDSNNRLQIVMDCIGTCTTGSGAHPTWASNGITVDNSGVNAVFWVEQPSEYLVIDADANTPISVSGEQPLTGAACGSNYPASYQTGNHCWTGYLSHASYVKNSVKIKVGGTQVAAEVYGAIDSTGFAGGLGAVTGHVSSNAHDSRVWVSLAFATVPAGAVTIDYQYINSEVAQVQSISGNTITFTNPLRNDHSGTYAVRTAYFRTAKIDNRWVLCDPLNKAGFYIGPDKLAVETNAGQVNNSQFTVNTTLSSSVTADASPQAIPLTSNAGLIPTMKVRIGGNLGSCTAPCEWVVVGGTAEAPTAVFTQDHAAGATVHCCVMQDVVNTKYRADATWGTLLNNTNSVWNYLQMSRMQKYGFNMTAVTDEWNVGVNSATGLADLPEHTVFAKLPFMHFNQECSFASTNMYGYGKDIVAVGNPQRLGSHIIDYFDPYFYASVLGSAMWTDENPWFLVTLGAQSDNCSGMAQGEHFATSAYGLAGTNSGDGYQAAHLGAKTMIGPAYEYVSAQSAGACGANCITAASDTFPNRQRPEGSISKTVALPQYLQGQLDPINFPTAASGNNIASISCSGSTAVVNLKTAWIGNHFDPFTVGSLVTISGFTGAYAAFNTASNKPAQVTVATQGSHQVALQYPNTNPCPATGSTTNVGLIALGPGYTNITALNDAWGSQFASFGSSGTWHQNVAESGSGNCSGGSSCSFPVTAPITPFSVTVMAWAPGVTAQNTCALTNPNCTVIAADEVTHPFLVIPLETDGICPTRGGAADNTDHTTACGKFHTNPASTSTLAAAVTTTGVVPFKLANYPSGPRPNPGSIIYIDDANASYKEFVRVERVINQPGQLTADGISWLIPMAPGFQYPHSSGTATYYMFTGASATSEWIYKTATTIELTLASPLPSGWKLTMNYQSGGWAAWTSNPGLLDEDGRTSEQTLWAGAGGFSGCVDPGTQSHCNGGTTGSNSYVRDIDGFAQEMIAYYRRNWMEVIRPFHPHSMVAQDYRGAGGRGSPGRRETIRANTPYVDLPWMGGTYAGYLTASQNLPTGCVSAGGDGRCTGANAASYPCIGVSGDWGLCKDFADDSMKAAIRLLGDVPFFDFYESNANADSDFSPVVQGEPACRDANNNPCNTNIAGYWNGSGLYDPATGNQTGAAKTQAERAAYMASYLNKLTEVAFDGVSHGVGVEWWAWQSTPVAGQFDAYGIVTGNDNVYDGVEACNRGTQPTTVNVAGYPLVGFPENTQRPGFSGGTNACYGNFVNDWTAAVASVTNSLGSPTTPTAAAPTFLPAAGTYTSAQNVSISTTTDGAAICYTTDSSTPTADGVGTCTHGTTYAAPVLVSSNTTLKAIASAAGYNDSSPTAAAYTINLSGPSISTIMKGVTVKGVVIK